MKLVFYDSTCLMPERISGVGVYAKHLYLALKKLGVPLRPVYQVSRLNKANNTALHIGDKAVPFLPLPPRAGAVFHGTDFKLAGGSSRYPRLVTIQDLAVFHPGYNSERFREAGRRNFSAAMAQKPDRIVVPCRSIAEELSERFPEAGSRISVIYHGADHLGEDLSPGEQGDYFLFVGHIEKRKNVDGIIRAFTLLSAKRPSLRLVLAGRGGFGFEEISAQIASSPCRDRIELAGHVDQDALNRLYRGALAFVFPSHYEGFGFPVLEAMRMGCPVIASSHGTVREIAGGAALEADASSPEDIAAKMEEIAADTGLRRALCEKGRARAAEFTWERCAREYIALYEALAAG